MGTGFNVGPGYVLTADHVVAGASPENVYAVSLLQPAVVRVARKVTTHPNSDMALLEVEPPHQSNELLQHFVVSPEHPGLGVDVTAYGYPRDPYGRSEPVARLMKGYVQHHYVQANDGYEYVAYELGMLSLPGLSGAPVFLQDDPEQVVGMVTRAQYLSGTPVWAMAASVVAARDWLVELIGGNAPDNR